MLKAFYDWPRKQIALYAESTVHSYATGVVATTFALREIRSVWLFTSGAMKKYFTEKVINENQFVAISETMAVPSDLVYFDSEWFRITADNVSFMDEVHVLALQRVEKPVYTGTLPVLNGGLVC